MAWDMHYNSSMIPIRYEANSKLILKKLANYQILNKFLKVRHGFPYTLARLCLISMIPIRYEANSKLILKKLANYQILNKFLKVRHELIIARLCLESRQY